MTETLKFGLNDQKPGLLLDAPGALIDRIGDSDDAVLFNDAKVRLGYDRVLRHSSLPGGGTELAFDAYPIRSRNPDVRQERLRLVYALISTLHRHALPREKSPRLQVLDLSGGDNGSGLLRLQLGLGVSATTRHEDATKAGVAMGRVAKSLKVVPGRYRGQYPQQYIKCLLRHGPGDITLRIGDSCLGTRTASRNGNLIMHNLYGNNIGAPEDPLIYLVGATALSAGDLPEAAPSGIM